MLKTYDDLTLAILLSLISGIGVFLMSVREKRFPASFLNALTECVISLVAGLTGFYIARERGWDESLQYIVVLVASNNGREVCDAVKNKLISIIDAVMGSKKGGERSD